MGGAKAMGNSSSMGGPGGQFAFSPASSASSLPPGVTSLSGGPGGSGGWPPAGVTPLSGPPPGVTPLSGYLPPGITAFPSGGGSGGGAGPAALGGLPPGVTASPYSSQQLQQLGSSGGAGGGGGSQGGASGFDASAAMFGVSGEATRQLAERVAGMQREHDVAQAKTRAEINRVQVCKQGGVRH